MTSLRFLAPPLAASLLLLPRLADAAGNGDIHQEYDQVHKIALRDPRVHDAFARANERLDARIVELDPALAGYVRTHPSVRGEYVASSAPAEPAAPVHPHHSAPRAQAAAAPVHAVAAPAPRRTHVVAQGETLSSIATQYGVSVANLQSTNHIQDARKLQVGQTLVIPGKGASATRKPSSSGAAAPSAANDNFWDKLKKGM